jgi:GxxExxY protein
MDTENKYLHQEITEKIISAYYNVYNFLGFGFLEKVYENSIEIELKKFGLEVEKQYPVSVYYDNIEVGKYFADIIVEQKVIVELKATEELCREHELQLINYLKATDFEIGLLLNFGKKADFKRKIFSNKLKNKKHI